MSITRCAVRHWRITATADRTAPEPFCPLSRVAARPVASPQPHRRHFADRAAAHRAALGRRLVRGVRSAEGKSGLKALRAPSPRIRHRAYGPAGYRHDSELSFGASKATASSSAPSPEGPIFHADEPRGPRRACAVGWESGADTKARPVSRRYAPVENALMKRIKSIWHGICDATGFGDSVIPL